MNKKSSRVSFALRRGQSALHVAAAFGRLEVMKELLVLQLSTETEI